MAHLLGGESLGVYCVPHMVQIKAGIVQVSVLSILQMVQLLELTGDINEGHFAVLLSQLKLTILASLELVFGVGALLRKSMLDTDCFRLSYA
jgi:hypothetical protein